MQRRAEVLMEVQQLLMLMLSWHRDGLDTLAQITNYWTLEIYQKRHH